MCCRRCGGAAPEAPGAAVAPFHRWESRRARQAALQRRRAALPRRQAGAGADAGADLSGLWAQDEEVRGRLQWRGRRLSREYLRRASPRSLALAPDGVLPAGARSRAALLAPSAGKNPLARVGEERHVVCDHVEEVLCTQQARPGCSSAASAQPPSGTSLRRACHILAGRAERQLHIPASSTCRSTTAIAPAVAELCLLRAMSPLRLWRLACTGIACTVVVKVSGPALGRHAM